MLKSERNTVAMAVRASLVGENVALYKEMALVTVGHGVAFDNVFEPGDAAPYAGIYRCDVCGREIAIAQGHTLPQDSHPRHPLQEPIQWRLLVFAQHEKR